jgi:hypothetical protein
MLQAHKWRLCNPAERTHFSLLKLAALAADVANCEKMVLYFSEGDKQRVRFPGY